MREVEATASCLLLALPGYDHCPRYRKKWESRPDDQWRLVDEYRWVLPLLSGYVKGPDGEEPAIIALSFTPRGASRIVSLQNAIQFFRDPFNAEWRFRTLVVSRIRDVEKCESFPVTLMREAAQKVTERLQEVLSGPAPANFVVKENLLDYLFGADPRELLRAVGLVTEQENSDDEVEEEGEFDDSEWRGEEFDDSGWEEAPREDEEEEGSGEDTGWSGDQDSDEDAIPVSSLADEYEQENRESTSPPSLPRRYDEPPAPPRDVYSPPPREEQGEEEGNAPPPLLSQQPGKGGEKPSGTPGVAHIVRRLYRPDPRTLRAYGISQEEEEEEVSSLQKLLDTLPPWPHVVVAVAISVLSYFIPQASWGMFLLAGGRAGLRMLVGAALLQALFLIYRAGMGIRYWWVYATVALLGIAFYFAGIKRLYTRDHLKFELATVSKKVANATWNAVKRKEKTEGGMAAAMPGAVTVKDVRNDSLLGAIPDFLFLLSPLLFIYPPLHPAGVALFLLLWHLERKKAAPWLVGIIVHTIVAMIGHPLPVKAEVVLWLFRLISYINVRSNSDLTTEKVRAAPAAVREFLRMFTHSPLGALQFVWSGKKVKVQKTVEYEVERVDDKVSALISGLSERVIANILSCLTPEQCEGWIRASEIAGVPIPIIARPKETGKFYHISYIVSIPPITRGDDILPDYRQRIMADFAQALAMERKVMISNGLMELPRVCRVSPQENIECALSPLPEPIVIGDGTGVIVPIGTSYIYYSEGGKHKHYASGILYDPDRSGHLLIVAPSGAGKSVFMRSLMNNLAAAAKVFPLRILYAEGKSELGGTERVEPFLTPFIFLSTGSIALRWISALLSIMDYRQAFHAALGKYLKDQSPPKQLFRGRYGHVLPQVVVVLDEYYAVSLLAKQMEQISVTDQEGRNLKVSAHQFFTSALALLVVLGRSMGVSMTFSTQSGRADAILPALRENCTMVAGNPGKIPAQILSNMLGSDLTSMKQIAFQLTGSSAAHLPGLFGWAFSSPRGATVAWIRDDGTYILAGDARAFPEEQPQWDVLFPSFYPKIEPATQLFPVQREKILQDVEMLASAGAMPKPPSCGWLKALAIDPFDTAEEFLRLGEGNMLNYLLASKEQLSIGQQGEGERE